MRVTAIIPAKGTSTRVPGKNLRPFGASTLVGHKVDQLLQCKAIDEVVVGSDCPLVRQDAAVHGAAVRTQDEYHTSCSANDMIRNLAAMVEADVVVWAHCTNPLVEADVYDDAVRAFDKARANGYDSLCSVTQVRRHAWMHGEPVNFDPWGETHPFAAELDTFSFQDGAIFIQPHRQMLDNAYFYGQKPYLFDIPAPYGWDIDTEHDLRIAQQLYGAGVCARQNEVMQ